MAKGKHRKGTAASKTKAEASPKDDGSKWLVVREGQPVYSVAVDRAEAERLRDSLLEPAEIIRISP